MTDDWICKEIKGPLTIDQMMEMCMSGLTLPKFKDESEITTDSILKLMIEKIKENQSVE
jgi:hypothetical protein